MEPFWLRVEKQDEELFSEMELVWLRVDWEPAWPLEEIQDEEP